MSSLKQNFCRLILSCFVSAMLMSSHISLASGQEPSTLEPYETFIVEHTIKSQFPVQDRKITVRLPENYYEEPNANYPVLYVLDGEENLDFTSAAAEFLASVGQIPELIIVGVHSGTTRQTDYRPQASAAQFLDFLETELVAFVAETYRASSYRMLSGHSLGGLLTTYVMTEKPELFQAYFAQSPTLNDEAVRQSIERLLSENTDLLGTYHITLGDEPGLEPGFNAVKEILETNAPVSFHWSSDRQLNRTHLQTRLIGVYHALEQNFARDWPLPAKLMENINSKAIKQHIDNVASKYGIDKDNYATDTLVGAVQARFQRRDVEGATKLSEILVSEYPESIIGHFFLANGYANTGRSDLALKQVNIAIELLEADQAPAAESAPLLAAMKRMQSRLTGN